MSSVEKTPLVASISPHTVSKVSLILHFLAQIACMHVATILAQIIINIFERFRQVQTVERGDFVLALRFLATRASAYLASLAILPHTFRMATVNAETSLLILVSPHTVCKIGLPPMSSTKFTTVFIAAILA